MFSQLGQGEREGYPLFVGCLCPAHPTRPVHPARPVVGVGADVAGGRRGPMRADARADARRPGGIYSVRFRAAFLRRPALAFVSVSSSVVSIVPLPRCGALCEGRKAASFAFSAAYSGFCARLVHS